MCWAPVRHAGIREVRGTCWENMVLGLCDSHMESSSCGLSWGIGCSSLFVHPAMAGSDMAQCIWLLTWWMEMIGSSPWCRKTQLSSIPGLQCKAHSKGPGLGREKTPRKRWGKEEERKRGDEGRDRRRKALLLPQITFLEHLHTCLRGLSLAGVGDKRSDVEGPLQGPEMPYSHSFQSPSSALTASPTPTKQYHDILNFNSSICQKSHRNNGRFTHWVQLNKHQAVNMSDIVLSSVRCTEMNQNLFQPGIPLLNKL